MIRLALFVGSASEAAVLLAEGVDQPLGLGQRRLSLLCRLPLEDGLLQRSTVASLAPEDRPQQDAKVAHVGILASRPPILGT